MYRNFLKAGAVFVLTTKLILAHDGHGNPAFAEIADDPKLPRVLLLGDSISIGYTVAVREQLQGIANVHRPPENCGPTTTGLDRMDAWVGDRTWDVVHFNFGLHDLKHIDPKGNLVDPAVGKIQVPLKDYQRNLNKLIDRLEKTRANLIWCSTTPVPEGALGRNPGDEIRYNQAALKTVLGRKSTKDILVNDLFTFAKSRITEIQLPEDVHFTPDGSRELAKQVAATIKEALEIHSQQPKTATGIVFHDANGNRMRDSFEQPLSGVRVSNGNEIVRTDEDGRFSLPIDDDVLLFVIKPSGYRTPLDENKLPQFYYNHKPIGSPSSKYPGVSPTGALPASVDFPLYPQSEPNQFKAILFGDPQPSNQKEVDYIAHDVVEELIGTDASFGVTLGDIANDDLDVFIPQARAIAVLGIPWYNVIGNHDMNYDAADDKQSDETFERVFGPSYYSFDYGPVHFLVLDDVEWFIKDDGKGTYRGGLGKRQLEFIRRDLAEIPKDQLLVVMMHIPLTDVGDRQELYRLIEQRPFCMSISAHRHTHEHRFITREDGWLGPEPHHHVVNVTVSGSWWQGQPDERGIPHATMTDGAPNGYSIISFDGSKYELDYRAAGRPADYQMNIYAPEVIKLAEVSTTQVLANVFNGSVRSKVELRWRGTENWKRMEHSLVEDPEFSKIHETQNKIRDNLLASGAEPTTVAKKLNNPSKSTHIWAASLPEINSTGLHVLEVQSTDMHGRILSGRRLVRVE